MDHDAPWSALVAIAFEVVRKPGNIQTLQLVTLTPVVPQSPSLCQDGTASSCSPASVKERNTRRDQNKELVAQQALLVFYIFCVKMDSDPDAVSRPAHQNMIFTLLLMFSTPDNLGVDDSASEGQGHLFRAGVQGRLLEVKRGLETGPPKHEAVPVSL